MKVAPPGMGGPKRRRRAAKRARLIGLGAAGVVVLSLGGLALARHFGGPSQADLIRSVNEAIAKIPDPGPGMGEPGPPPSTTTGFTTDFSRHSVPLSEITPGGPGKDGIPALDHPRFLPVAKASFLRPQEPVISFRHGGVARAYPIQILVWHEIVNDVVAGTPVAVTFCPLCNTAIVFDRRVGARTLDFGTTGNLRNSDLVMYDRQTESWWQQFTGQAIVGRYTGTRLRVLPARIEAWRDFRAANPGGEVLSRKTGYSRPYGDNPYYGYDEIDRPPYFPAAHGNDTRLPPKERVVFLERGKDAVAVPFSALRKRRTIRVTVGSSRIVIRWRPGTSSPLGQGGVADGRDIGAVDVREAGKLVQFDEPFWFAVAAFRPDVRIIRR